MLPSLDDYLHAKNRRHRLIPCSNIVDQRILQSDWVIRTPGHVQPNVVVSLVLLMVKILMINEYCKLIHLEQLRL